MSFSLPSKIKTLSAVLLAAAVLSLAIALGASSGKVQAQALSVSANAREIGKALKYFYSDYSRFPTAVEYQNQNLMLNYFDRFPLQDFVSRQCAQSYSYERVSNSSYQLDFCLPRSVDRYRSGWNQLTENK